MFTIYYDCLKINRKQYILLRIEASHLIHMSKYNAKKLREMLIKLLLVYFSRLILYGPLRFCICIVLRSWQNQSINYVRVITRKISNIYNTRCWFNIFFSDKTDRVNHFLFVNAKSWWNALYIPICWSPILRENLCSQRKFSKFVVKKRWQYIWYNTSIS